MDLEAWQEASLYLQELIERGSYTDAALYNLGRCHEALKQPLEAIETYQQVSEGQYFMAAQQQLGGLWLQQDNTVQFDKVFAQARSIMPEEQPALLQIEVETLSSNQRTEQAWQRIQHALLLFPDNSNLLYTRAMLAEKRDNLQQLEADLRQILSNEPEHSIAMNALGYTLADRTDRYEKRPLPN